MKKKLEVVVLISIIIVSVSCTSTSQKIDNDMEITPAIENIFSRKSVRSYEDKDIDREGEKECFQQQISLCLHWEESYCFCI